VHFSYLIRISGLGNQPLWRHSTLQEKCQFTDVIAFRFRAALDREVQLVLTDAMPTTACLNLTSTGIVHPGPELTYEIVITVTACRDARSWPSAGIQHGSDDFGRRSARENNAALAPRPDLAARLTDVKVTPPALL
jgi:hypothetical protein